LVHPHHQKSFWAYVGRYIPNWKVLRKELNN
jgi:predicted metal-dependent hydrolase